MSIRENAMAKPSIFANETDVELQPGDVDTEDMKRHVEESS